MENRLSRDIDSSRDNNGIFSHYLAPLKCHGCGKEYRAQDIDYVCPDHSDNNRLDVLYDYELISREWRKEDLSKNLDLSIKRYAPLLPVSQQVLNAVPYHVGGTPLIKATNTEQALGMKNVYVKFDSANLSGSLKDRASFLVTALAKAKGVDVIAAASSGNAASSLAAVCAAANMPAVLFVPRDIPQTKLTQIAIYGATALVVDGSYNQAFELCEKSCEEFGWYSRNTGFNPYTREGKKTVAFEIAEQLNWNVPDWVLVPVGDGCIISGVEKGFRDLYELGWIDKIPKLVGIQAEKAPSIYNAWKKGAAMPDDVEATSIVDSINVGNGQDGAMALRAIKQTNGLCMTLSDDEMKGAMNLLATREGLLGCLAGSLPLVALEKLKNDGVINSDEIVVLLNTGHGLKDMAHHFDTKFENIISVQPNVGDVEKVANRFLAKV